MNKWYAILPDWQIGLAWLVVTAIAAVIYFFPMAPILEAMAD
jgi:hypothetical protein